MLKQFLTINSFIDLLVKICFFKLKKKKSMQNCVNMRENATPRTNLTLCEKLLKPIFNCFQDELINF